MKAKHRHLYFTDELYLFWAALRTALSCSFPKKPKWFVVTLLLGC